MNTVQQDKVKYYKGKQLVVDADIIITTAHRAKGLEWDHIELAEDFQDVSD
jgi:superfamily I DNA/RNA helicase